MVRRNASHFVPATITAKVGQKITWTNNDSVAHTVTKQQGVSGPGPASGTVNPGSIYSFTPTKAGKIPYFCQIHPNQKGTIVVGPIVSGELKPEREAKLRAEVGGSMLNVSVLEAQAVQQGAILGRIETRTLEDARQSAASSVRSAENQLSVSKRDAERTEKLAAAGALATRDVDAAHNAVSTAEAQVADAKSRLATAERSLGDTVIRAPFTGIVVSM